MIIGFLQVMIEYLTSFLLLTSLVLLTFILAREKTKPLKCLLSSFIIILLLIFIQSLINMFVNFLTLDVWQGVEVVRKIGDFCMILGSMVLLGVSVSCRQLEHYF